MKKACSKEGWNLSPEQNSRWDYAVAEYQRLTDEIVEKKRAFLSKEFRDELINDGLIRLLSGVNPPGDKKSALFKRLLNGKAALPFIPPKRHGYPWYAPFDRPDETHEVIEAFSFEQTYEETEVLEEWPCPKKWLFIDQERWSVLWANQPATEIAEWGAIDWGDGELLAKDQYTENEEPVFIVKYGDAPNCRLTTGRKTREIRRAALEMSPMSPMDINFSHPIIKKIIKTSDEGYRMDWLEIETDTWTIQVID